MPMRAHVFARTRDNVQKWRHAPVTGKDQALGAFAGGIGFFWIALILLAVLRVGDIAPFALAIYIACMMIVGIVLGIRFPKAISAVCYPFLTIN